MNILEKKEYLKKLQRTRNLAFWHDCSTVSNHSHFLMMVITLYDKAIFLTDEEFHEKSGKKTLRILNDMHVFL